MQADFHYYATYAAAFLAGYRHEEALEIACSANFVDCLTRAFLDGIGGPPEAATTQLQLELMNARTDLAGLQDITRIWASFHFLPVDLKAVRKGATKRYQRKYRLIAGPNGELLEDTVELAKGKSTQAAGVAMHVLADTWAHRYFAGTPSLVINSTSYHFYEILPDGTDRQIRFSHNPIGGDDLGKGLYVATVQQNEENSIMNLGHGRAGHLPDYSFMRYRYLPSWGDYEEIVKDNPSDYYHAFTQMVYAMRYLRGDFETFECRRYDEKTVHPYEERIREILEKRQLDASEDWKAFGEQLSGQEIRPFEIKAHQEEYRAASPDEKDGTFLGKFILAALAQKSMVTNRIFKSGNSLAGFSIDFLEKGFQGISDYRQLAKYIKGGILR